MPEELSSGLELESGPELDSPGMLEDDSDDDSLELLLPLLLENSLLDERSPELDSEPEPEEDSESDDSEEELLGLHPSQQQQPAW